jgi:hypothetical protein
LTGGEKLLNPRIIELEGQAMVGLVKKVKLEDCNEFPVEGWKRIVAELVNGEVYETGCMEEDDARRNYMVLALYTRRWGKIINNQNI